MIDNKPGSIQVLWRATALMDALAASDRPMSLTELFRQVGLNKSTTLNILSTLVELGFVSVVPETRQYRLGPHLLALGSAFQASFHITDVIRPFLADVRDATGETSSLHVRVGWERTCVAQAPSPQAIRRVIDIGRRRPLYSGAAGLIILSSLSDAEVKKYLARTAVTAFTSGTETDKQRILENVQRARTSEIAMVFADTEPGVSACAVPIRDHTGNICAAIVVSGPDTRFDKKAMRKAAPAIRASAAEASRSLGWRDGTKALAMN